MTIFFILLVVGMLLSVSRLLHNVKLCYPQLTYSWIDLSLYILTHSHLSRPKPPLRIYVFSTAYLNGQGQLCPKNLCRVKRPFKPHQNEHNSFKDTGARKRQNNHVTLTWKFPWKSRSTTLLPLLSSHPKILKAFLKTFPPKMKPTKCPAREKQHEARKAQKRGGEKAKSKSQDCCFTFKLKNYLKILLSAHAIRRPWIVWPVNSFVVSCSSS